jgi:hypothetical protein
MLLLSSAVFLEGCATTLESKLAQGPDTKSTYSFNFSKTQNSGKLMLHCVPPSTQLVILYYRIKIDQNKPIEVYKYSDSECILDEGRHILELSALPGQMEWLYKDQFGKSYVYEIEIAKGQTVNIEYTGFYSIDNFYII